MFYFQTDFPRKRAQQIYLKAYMCIYERSILGLPFSAGKESTCNAGELGLIPALGRSPGEGTSYPLQYSGLENSMDCIVHGVAKHQTQLSDFHFQTHHCI